MDGECLIHCFLSVVIGRGGGGGGGGRGIYISYRLGRLYLGFSVRIRIGSVRLLV